MRYNNIEIFTLTDAGGLILADDGVIHKGGMAQKVCKFFHIFRSGS
jgi:hypothetical protein